MVTLKEKKMKTFNECIEHRKFIDSNVKHYSDILNSFPSGKMGLIPDEYKKSDLYINADKQFNHWFSKLQELNKFMVKTYKKELRELRKNRFSTVQI